MSAADLGARMGVSRKAVVAMQANARGRSSSRPYDERPPRWIASWPIAIVPIDGDLEGSVQAQAGRVVDIEHAASRKLCCWRGSS